MKIISDDEGLHRFHFSGVGLIYNDYVQLGSYGYKHNALHAASCFEISKMNLKHPKFYFEDLDDARAWLNSNRGPEGVNWKRCGMCEAQLT